jgi:hypothetical protein
MIESYPLDKGRLYFLLGVNAVLFVYMLFDQKRLPELFKKRDKFRRSLIKMFLVGVLILVVSSVLVALSFHSWDLNLIKEYLLFKNLGLKPGGLPYSRTIGYQFISFGILTLVVYFVRSSREPEEITEAQNTTSDNISYVNARYESIILQYAMIATLLLIAPLGLLYGFISLLINQGFVFNILTYIVFIVMCLAWAGMALVFKIVKKYWVFKISIDPSGIRSFGLFRSIYAHWNEIISIEVVSSGILFGGKMIEVKTPSGNIYFPLTMKEKDKEYPKLDTIGEHWIDLNGEKKQLTPETCMLYTTIKQKKIK